MQVLGKETTVFLVIKYMLFMAIFMREINGKTSLNANDISKEELPIHLDCGGSLIADFTSNIIVPPELPENETKIYCEWLIEAKHPSYSVGVLVLIDHDINIYFENHFKLDVYDGSQAKQSKQLFSWPGVPEKGFYYLLGGVQSTSTSSKIFLNYTKFAHDGLLDVVVHYFICGGQLDTGIEFSSPLFMNTSFPIPSLISCEWEIIKPTNAIYTSLEFEDVNLPLCNLLSLATTNGTLMAIEFDIPDNDPPEYSETSSTIDQNDQSPDLTLSQSDLERSPGSYTNDQPVDYYVTSPSKPFRKVAVTNICNNNTDNIVYAFSGPSAALHFVGNSSTSFSAIYKVVFPPYTDIENKSVSWFYSYIQVLIYMPVGFAIGLGIICCQGRKKRYLFRTLNRRLRKVQRENSDDVSSWVETGTTASTRLQYNCGVVAEEADAAEMMCIRTTEISNEVSNHNNPLLLHGSAIAKDPSDLSSANCDDKLNGSHNGATVTLQNDYNSLG